MFDAQECSRDLSTHSRDVRTLSLVIIIYVSNYVMSVHCSSLAHAKSLTCEMLLNALFVDLPVANSLISLPTFLENQHIAEENGLWPFTKIEYGPNFNCIDSKIFREFT